MSEELQQQLASVLEAMQAQGLDPVVASTAGAAALHLYEFVRDHGTAGVVALGLVVGLVAVEGRPVRDAFIDKEE